MKPRIPKEIILAGITIRTVYDDTLAKRMGAIGRAEYGEQTIYIDPTNGPSQLTEQAYIHEVIHWIFFIIGYEKERIDEKMVDLFAHMAYQIITTTNFNDLME